MLCYYFFVANDTLKDWGKINGDDVSCTIAVSFSRLNIFSFIYHQIFIFIYLYVNIKYYYTI